MSCHCIDTYTNGYGHEVCSDCGRVIETTASDSTETPKRMKPLDKLEQVMFKTLTGFDFNENLINWKTQIENARAAAQVAKDLARRAYLFNTPEFGSNKVIRYSDFLESEGITEQP